MDIDLGSVISTLWRGKFWIFLCTLTTTLISIYLVAFVAILKYYATTVSGKQRAVQQKLPQSSWIRSRFNERCFSRAAIQLSNLGPGSDTDM